MNMSTSCTLSSLHVEFSTIKPTTFRGEVYLFCSGLLFQIKVLCVITTCIPINHGLKVCACVRAHACEQPDAWAYACAYVRVTLLIQRVTFISHTVSSYVASFAPPYFSTCLINGTILKKKSY